MKRIKNAHIPYPQRTMPVAEAMALMDDAPRLVAWAKRQGKAKAPGDWRKYALTKPLAQPQS